MLKKFLGSAFAAGMFCSAAFAQPSSVSLAPSTSWTVGRSILFCYNPASSPNYTAGACGSIGNPVWITPATSANATAPSQPVCGNTATLVDNADTNAIHREINNNTAGGIVYWGKSNAVTTGTGMPIQQGSGYDFTGYSGPIYCITAGSITVGYAKW